MANNNTRKNAFEALIYLVWVIIKQQWKTLLALVIFVLIIIPMPKLIVAQGAYETTANGVIGLFFTLPVLLITLVYLPMVHNQIYSSSIKKRLSASGVPPMIYAITMILLFSAIAIVAFYGLSIIAYLIWHNAVYTENYGSGIYVQQIWYLNSVNWFSYLILSPIAIIGLSSSGLLIGRWKISEIIKGVSIFFLILIVILMSRTIFNPMFSDMSYIDGYVTPYMETINPMAKSLSIMFISNPWASMLFTLQDSFDHKLHSLVNVGSGDTSIWETRDTSLWNGMALTLTWSTISSIGFAALAITTMK